MTVKPCSKSTLWIAAGLMMVSPMMADAETHEDHVLATLEKTRHFTTGGHSMTPKIDYVYPRSMLEMASSLTEDDIPVLLRILERDNDYQGKYSDGNRNNYNRNYKLAQAASFGLASLCGKSIGPIVAEVKARRLDSNMASKNDPLHWIEAFSQVPGGCSPQDARLAKTAQKEIEQLSEARWTQERSDHQQKQSADDNARNRINRNGLKMLDPEAAKTLTMDEREEVFRTSVKAMGLDKSVMTPEEKMRVQKMYDTMVLQQPGHSSNQ